jgi:hypothetical protein
VLPLPQMGVQVHVAALNAWPLPQLVLTHCPLQVVKPLLQVKPQVGGVPAQVAVACAGGIQTVPHAPQWLTSLPVFTQAVPQSVAVGGVQLMPQTGGVPAQVAMPVPAVGPGQTVPQLPQLLGDCAVQVPPQFSSPAAQQTPLAQKPLWHCPCSEQAPPMGTELLATQVLVAVSQLKPPAWLHWLSVVQLVGQLWLLPSHRYAGAPVQTSPAVTAPQVPVPQVAQPPVQTVAQQTPLTQNPVAQSVPAEQLPACGTRQWPPEQVSPL